MRSRTTRPPRLRAAVPALLAFLVAGGVRDSRAAEGPESDEAIAEQPAEQPAEPLAEVEQAGGVGRKLLFIGLPVLAAGSGGAAYYLATQNQRPSGGTIGVSAALALVGVTEIEFRSQGANDPDGDGLSYEWDFGDGTSGSGEVVRHVFGTAGTFTVSLAVRDAKLSAPAAPVQVTVKSVAGTWKADHRWLPSLALVQEGTRLTGSYADSAGGGALLPGSQVEAPATLVAKVEIASATASWRATLTCGLDAAFDECLGHFIDDGGGRDYGLFRFTRQ